MANPMHVNAVERVFNALDQIPRTLAPGEPDRRWLAENLVMPKEIASRAGLSRRRTDQLATHADFPEPVAELGAGKVYLWPEVQAFLIPRMLI